jgi:hypothetical protein
MVALQMSGSHLLHISPLHLDMGTSNLSAPLYHSPYDFQVAWNVPAAPLVLRNAKQDSDIHSVTLTKHPKQNDG